MKLDAERLVSMGATPYVDFDSSAAWELNPQVTIRLEPFGGLAYHYGNRRLTFLRSPHLVLVLRTLARHESADAALAASGLGPDTRDAFRQALSSLAAAEVIRARRDAARQAIDCNRRPT